MANRKAELALSGGPTAVFVTMNIIGSWRDQMANKKPSLALSGGPTAVFVTIPLALGVTKWPIEKSGIGIVRWVISAVLVTPQYF
jgi:hypothetical protein